MYQAHLLLRPATDFTLKDAAERLATKLPGFTFERTDSALSLFTSDWEIHLTMNSGPEVLADSARVAEHLAGEEDGRDIASIDRRVEIESDFSDPEMDHFGDYQTIIETLQSFHGVIAVDPTEPSLL